jgi:maltooligosyltrehalose trehalohydrolase
MTDTSSHLLYGARYVPGGPTQFRLWAPSQRALKLRTDDGRSIDMTRTPDGFFVASIEAPPGTGYQYELSSGTRVPDPASRLQSEDVHGWSVVVDHGGFPWRDASWKGRPWRDAVIFELHAGCYGGFSGIAERLDDVKRLGVTAIEIMPINDFPGARNWGYDGVLPFAPDRSYGHPDDLKRLIDTAHQKDMMVYLDVVYNHFGPDGNYISLYAPEFFRTDVSTPWGPAIDFRRPEVRAFFSQNVQMWLRDYHFDGLRFDAVHAITEQSWIEEISADVRSEFDPQRQVHLVLEHHNYAQHLERDVDAQWNDDAHNAIHVLLTDEGSGYYADYAKDPTAALLRCLLEGWYYQGQYSEYLGENRGSPSSQLTPTAHVFFLQNHDQTGNRAFGERLTVLAKTPALEAAIALQMLCPQIPLLFMGEESASTSPFLFFTDHNADLATAVREGRRKEFAGFPEFRDEARRATIPDPNHPDTFRASVPRPDPALGDDRRRLYRDLLAIRRRELVPYLDATKSVAGTVLGPKALQVSWQQSDGSMLTIAVNLGDAAVALSQIPGRLIFSSAGNPPGSLPGFCTLAFLDRRS